MAEDSKPKNDFALMTQATGVARIVSAFYLAAEGIVGNRGVALALTYKWMELNLQKTDVDPQKLDKAVKKLLGLEDKK